MFRGEYIFNKGEGSRGDKFNRFILDKRRDTEEEVLDKEIGFSDNIFNDMDSKASKFLEREERVKRVKRSREIFTEANKLSDTDRVRGIRFINLIDSFFKSVDTERIKSKERGIKFFKGIRGVERREDMKIIDRSRFRGDFNRRRVKFIEDREDKRDSIRNTFRGVFKGFNISEEVTCGINNSEGEGVGRYIQTDKDIIKVIHNSPPEGEYG